MRSLLRGKDRPHARRQGVRVALAASLIALLACRPVSAATPPEVATGTIASLQFAQQSASPEVTHVAHWVSDSGDNQRMPYLIIDKVNARVFAFDAHGRLQGAAPALLGMGRGDVSVAGIGHRKMSAIGPEDRITPAGRFLVSLDHDLHGKEVLLVDYAASIALHPVVKGTPQERRAQRLESATSADNRISYGCINVPVKFYATIVSPAFAHSNGLVYILPETSKANAISGLFDADADTKERTAPRL